jgi:hypothetical protein
LTASASRSSRPSNSTPATPRAKSKYSSGYREHCCHA